MIAAVAERVPIPVFVLIRPRGGGFVYSDADIDVMTRDIEVARNGGARGVVIGTLDHGGRADIANTLTLLKTARGLPVTFHRAFDFAPNLSEALEQLIDAGVTRVLTSGGVATALEGVDAIARLVDQARGRITVMAGGGVREQNVQEIIARTGVSEVHARIGMVLSCSSGAAKSTVRLRKPLPTDEDSWEELDEARMRALVDLARP